MLIPSFKAEGVEVLDLHEEIDKTKEKLKDLENDLDYVVKSELTELGKDFYKSISNLLHKKVQIKFKDYVVSGTLNRINCIPMTNLEKLCIELEIDGMNHGTYDPFEIKEVI